MMPKEEKAIGTSAQGESHVKNSGLSFLQTFLSEEGIHPISQASQVSLKIFSSFRQALHIQQQLS